MQGRVFVYVAEHRGERRTLAGTGWTADQHEPFHELKGLEHSFFVEVEFGELWRLDLYQTQDGSGLIALQEGIDAEAPFTLGHAIKGIIDLAIAHPAVAETGGQGRIDERM